MKDPALYNNLSAASESANLLMENMRKQPNRYVQFSLINRSKSTYLNDKGLTKTLDNNAELTYLVVVKKTINAVSIDKGVFVKPNIINEYKYKDTYYYHTGEYKLYNDAVKRLEVELNDYPDASILVLKSGKPIPIDKVIK